MAVKEKNSDHKARLYAQSILDMARAENAVEPLEQGFKSLKEEILSNLKLKSFLEDSTIEKAERIKTAFGMLEGDYNPLIKAVLTVMITMDMVEEIENTYLAFIELVSDFKKQVYVEVISAIELDSGTLGRIKKEVDLNTSLDVRIGNTVDRDIVGGLVIKIGGKVIDLSIRSKLEDMRSRLKSIELRGEEFGTED